MAHKNVVDINPRPCPQDLKKKVNDRVTFFFYPDNLKKKNTVQKNTPCLIVVALTLLSKPLGAAVMSRKWSPRLAVTVDLATMTIVARNEVRVTGPSKVRITMVLSVGLAIVVVVTAVTTVTTVTAVPPGAMVAMTLAAARVRARTQAPATAAAAKSVAASAAALAAVSARATEVVPAGKLSARTRKTSACAPTAGLSSTRSAPAFTTPTTTTRK